MKIPQHARTRLMLSAGALLGLAGVLSAAAFTDQADVVVTIDGSQNTFDLVTAGSLDPAWSPSAADWAQGNPDPLRLSLAGAGALGPGHSLDLRIAARNASPRLAASLSLSITDPDPLGDEIDPQHGTYRELFDQLEFTVREGATVLLDAVPATALEAYVWPADFAAGDEVVLDVSLALPREVDDRWQRAGTGVEFSFQAVNR